MNKTNRVSLCWASVAALTFLLPLLGSFAGQRGLPAQEGILNFGKVNDQLYRGAQPGEVGLKSLQRLGVKTIVDLRMPDKDSRAEAMAAQASGILYTNVPFHGLGRPADRQIQQVLSLLENSSGPVFVHCEHGCDRTGTVIACYRIKHDRWPNQAALTEAGRYGLSKLERGMKRYILAFGGPSPADHALGPK